MRLIRFVALVLASFVIAPAAAYAQASIAGVVPQDSATAGNAPGREMTLNGCLLGKGYAGFMINNAQMGAVLPPGSKPEAPAVAAAVVIPKTWMLEGGGNLRTSLGKHVQVTGRTEWQPPAAGAAKTEEVAETPRLQVESVKAVADACPKPAP